VIGFKELRFYDSITRIYTKISLLFSVAWYYPRTTSTPPAVIPFHLPPLTALHGAAAGEDKIFDSVL
jgi:hypothetical protein